MGGRYLVRGELSTAFTVGRFLGPIAILVGIVVLLAAPPAGIFIIAVGVLLTVIFELSATMTRMKRCWIEVRESSFLVTDRAGTREVRDDEVQSIAYSSTTNFSNGSPSGFTRKCSLWLSKEPRPIEMENRFKQGQVDPLGNFIGRLIDLLHDGFDAAITAGHAIEGDAWRLTQSELSFRLNNRDEVLRLDEIAAIESREGKMGVWRKGQDEPYVGFPVNGRNVWLLRRLMQSRLKEDDAANEPPKDGLGRILFQRKSSIGTVVGVAVLGVILPIVGIAFVLFPVATEMFIAGVVMIIAGPLLVLAAYSLLRSNFRCHEWGVYQRTMTAEKRLLYSEVASFTHSATRHYHNGAYTGTQLSMTFVPLPGAKSGTIQYGTQVRNEDADLDGLRDFVSKVIAGRMGRELSEGRLVPWTKSMTFRPDGIEYTPGGFFGKKPSQFLPHAEYGGWNMDQGVFYLFQRGQPKAVMSVQSSEANFYPGFFLLLDLYHREPAAAESG
jgi:hypothetical protein